MAEDIDDLSLMVAGCAGLLEVVEMDVAVNHVFGGEPLQEPAEAGKTTVAGILPVSQMAGR